MILKMCEQLFICVLLFSTYSFGQAQNPIATVEFIKIKNNNQAEALFFYQNNWKVFRETALQKKFIQSYKLLQLETDSTSTFDFILITEFANANDYKLSEERFQKIIKSVRPTGPKLLNNLLPKEFRETVFLKITESIINPDNKKR